MTSVGRIECPKKHVLVDVGSPYHISALLREQICYLGQQLVFEEAETTFYKMCGIEIGAKQIERVCHYYGEKLEEKQQHDIRIGANEGKQNDRQSYYAMLDGGMILTREEKWKEVKLARIFDKRHHTIVSKERGYIGSSTYVAHLGKHWDFLEKVEYHLDTKGDLIFIADGAPWIWKWAEAKYPESQQILDFYHAKQHLCGWAEIAIKNHKRRQKWIDNQTLWLLNNGVEVVIKKISRMPASTAQAKQCKNALIEYYTMHKNRMRYKTYRENGLLIGSGPIEAAHRHVIHQRLKLSGQRWTIKGAQQIANLRVANKSNQWNQIVELTKKAA